MALKQFESSYGTAQHARRPLKIFIADPLVGRLSTHPILIKIKRIKSSLEPKDHTISTIKKFSNQKRTMLTRHAAALLTYRIRIYASELPTAS